jgi:hypothetical protein
MDAPDSAKTPRVRPLDAVIQEFKSVLTSSIAGNLQAAGRIRNLLTISAPNLRRSAPFADSPKIAANGDVVRILDFALASVKLLTEHSLMIVNGILDEAEARLQDRESIKEDLERASPASAESSGVEIVIKGAPGDRAGSAFLLENKYDRNVEVSFEASDFIAEGRPPVPGVLLDVEPKLCILSPRGQAVVRFSVLIGEAFAPGESYVAVLRTVGFEAQAIRVRLNVDPRAKGPVTEAKTMTASGSKPTPKRPRKRPLPKSAQ